MIKKHYIYNKVAAALLAAVTLTSCGDFLEILPMNEVVKENFWTKKEDVTNVLNACYASFSSKESVTRMAAWGEMRSENLMAIGGANGDADKGAIIDVLKEGTKTTNVMAKWNVMYTTINQCNTFIKFAPEVEAIDPNYTKEELEENIAEVTFIRDVCYFNLLRAFGAVPMSFDASTTDQQEYQIPATELNEGIDRLINDLKSVESIAKRRYADDTRTPNSYITTELRKNTSRVTRWAVYALLADLNLWRGNYDEVIRYCDMIIEYKKQVYEARKAYMPASSLNDMDIYAGVPLIRERILGSSSEGNAYNEIFADGNSCESIFEIDYKTEGNNDFVSNFYGGSSPFYAVPTFLHDAITGNTNTWFSIDDCRAYENFDKSDTRATVGKYVTGNLSFDITKFTSSNAQWPHGSTLGKANWIIYRLTDIMLMKAEALLLKGSAFNAEAFDLINAVYCRAHSISTTTTSNLNIVKTLATDKNTIDMAKNQMFLIGEADAEGVYTYKFMLDRDNNSTYTVPNKKTDICINLTKTLGNEENIKELEKVMEAGSAGTDKAFMDLLFAERHRELMFEGKRWYDLVRRTLRENDWTFLSNNASFKQNTNRDAVKTKLQDGVYIFLPYLKDELKVNRTLRQNPKYGNTEDFVQ